TVNAVAARLRADVVDGVADARGHALDDVRGLRNAETEHVDQRIARVRRLEGDLSADSRNADAVAVAGDAGDDAVEQARGAGRVELAESQRIQERDRTRAHGE